MNNKMFSLMIRAVIRAGYEGTVASVAEKKFTKPANADAMLLPSYAA